MMISPLSFAQPFLSFPVKRLAYNPGIHHRRSIRLKGYDYSQGGLYLVTINIQHRKCLLGTVENGEMTLHDVGIIACQQWEKLPERFSNIELDVFQIMPNHMHGILLLTDAASVGAGPPLPNPPLQSPEILLAHINRRWPIVALNCSNKNTREKLWENYGSAIFMNTSSGMNNRSITLQITLSATRPIGIKILFIMVE